MNLIIINGPSLNLIGSREPKIYGSKSFDLFIPELRNAFKMHTIEYFQSNGEGQIIDEIQKAANHYDGIIINAGAYSHTSIAIADSIASINVPVVEVHISNVFSREQFRRHSYLSEKCIGIISGFGLNGYKLAIEALLSHLNNQ